MSEKDSPYMIIHSTREQALQWGSDMSTEQLKAVIRSRAMNLPGGWLPVAFYRMALMAAEQIGKTEQQMRLAPMRAVFICCNSEHDHVEYARQLAKKIGRDDLEIWPPSMLDDQKNALRSFTGVVLDHAVMLTSKQIYTLAAMKARVGKK